MIFKAKIKGKQDIIEGNSLVKETSSGDYIIFKTGLYWCDGTEYQATIKDYGEFIDIETLEIIK